ncbi:MAG: RagB/SusD family nutrient uptake outer membrane protein [Balneolaceae bacterium]|nr:RagB/SusD family nutrient uptake outer membrane protein [Balneolaceae bacterium]MBO6546898.1 RagB/SusD family nutrient uptake outer membrane protein [Balneolaceae bacterium]MBO6649258.1 RagB/SusD family nutrient uptake outer membrane protein [Balneolaceae bacterium]
MSTKKTILILSISLILISCEGFLDVRPQSELTQEAFPTSASDALQATNAVYSTLRSWHYHSGGFPVLDVMSDDGLKGSNPDDGSTSMAPFEDFSFAATQTGLDRWWNALYEGIRRANIVIEKVPEIEMDETLKTRYIAEARFLRGIYYFDLVRAFGGVPLVTTINPDLKLERSTAEEIYTLLEADLQFAIDNLPLKSEYSVDQLGRGTKGAAQALKARVHLFKGEFDEVETLSLAVINSNEYDLEDVFIDANGVNGEHGVESVFEIGAIASGSPEGNQYANTQGVRGTPNRGWGFNRPSMDLRATFETDDPRFEDTIIELGEVLDGITILGDGSTPDETRDEGGNLIEIESYNQKVWYPGTNTTTQWGHNRRLVRFADVLLMAAEALNENDQPVQALVYLNRVRERARQGDGSILPDIAETDKDLLRDIILHERRVELALEGHRFWDLVRTGRAPEVLGPLGFIEGKHEFFPIPQSEIDLSQGSLEQNDMW